MLDMIVGFGCYARQIDVVRTRERADILKEVRNEHNHVSRIVLLLPLAVVVRSKDYI